MGDGSMPFTREMGHIINWPRGNLGELCKRYSLQLSTSHAVLTTTHAEDTIADNNLLIIEAATELDCLKVVATWQQAILWCRLWLRGTHDHPCRDHHCGQQLADD